MKIRVVFLFVVSLGLFSCSSDDDAPSVMGSLVGTWELTSVTGGIPVDLNMDGTPSTNLLQELPCFKDTLVVNDDNTYSQDVTDIDVSVDTSGPFPIPIVECTGLILMETGTWSLVGDQLTFTPEGQDPTIVAIMLTETTLSFSDTVEGLGQVALMFTRQ
ncbi:lipocalin family protein [Aquimarina sp. MMG016]|uniref:lipocalin family protein n=1 Tax=Aquimarina sp. MMG016 TaxID=2822690 RepID=UPI001B39D5BB|nr:lipocalin family protein [Aquimarina sp. MMG016]MBQ4818721.1 lipocalin family protein [Aquimarina sp. MMG016]